MQPRPDAESRSISDVPLGQGAPAVGQANKMCESHAFEALQSCSMRAEKPL